MKRKVTSLWSQINSIHVVQLAKEREREKKRNKSKEYDIQHVYLSLTHTISLEGTREAKLASFAFAREAIIGKLDRFPAPATTAAKTPLINALFFFFFSCFFGKSKSTKYFIHRRKICRGKENRYTRYKEDVYR